MRKYKKIEKETNTLTIQKINTISSKQEDSKLSLIEASQIEQQNSVSKDNTLNLGDMSKELKVSKPPYKKESQLSDEEKKKLLSMIDERKKKIERKIEEKRKKQRKKIEKEKETATTIDKLNEKKQMLEENQSIESESLFSMSLIQLRE